MNQEQEYNVLSEFDGMSCGQLALLKTEKKVTNYFASEIDKYSMQIAIKNFPNTKQLGDVTKIKIKELPKIHLFIAGSPCQGFSFAGKQLNFNDPRSTLFFEFAADLRFIQEFINEDVEFLLENVKMKKEYQDVISKFLGVEPVKINSCLLSAQNRERYYWTNIKNISLPDDKGVLLKDILECKSDDYIKISKKGVYKKYQEKSSTLTAGANSGGNHSDMDLIGIKKTCLQIGEASDINGHDILKRIYSEFGKSPTLSTCGGGNTQPKVAINDYEYRRLTPLEFERLQTVPDKYTEGVSNSQRYKMLGNGWTVDVIAHIFKNLS